jgi:hypothetical protein
MSKASPSTKSCSKTCPKTLFRQKLDCKTYDLLEDLLNNEKLFAIYRSSDCILGDLLFGQKVDCNNDHRMVTTPINSSHFCFDSIKEVHLVQEYMDGELQWYLEFYDYLLRGCLKLYVLNAEKSDYFSLLLKTKHGTPVNYESLLTSSNHLDSGKYNLKSRGKSQPKEMRQYPIFSATDDDSFTAGYDIGSDEYFKLLSSFVDKEVQSYVLGHFGSVSLNFNPTSIESIGQWVSLESRYSRMHFRLKNQQFCWLGKSIIENYVSFTLTDLMGQEVFTIKSSELELLEMWEKICIK